MTAATACVGAVGAPSCSLRAHARCSSSGSCWSRPSTAGLAIAFVDEIGGLEDASFALARGDRRSRRGRGGAGRFRRAAGSVSGGRDSAAARPPPRFGLRSTLTPPHRSSSPSALTRLWATTCPCTPCWSPRRSHWCGGCSEGSRGRPPRRFTYPAATLVALVCLSLLWSLDREEGINQVLLFGSRTPCSSRWLAGASPGLDAQGAGRDRGGGSPRCSRWWASGR